MLIAGQRIELDPKPQASAAPPLEVVMLGHCPVSADAVDWRRIAGDETLLGELHALGFDSETRRLRQLLEAPSGQPDSADDIRLKALYELPLPIHSLDQFKSIFRNAFDHPCQYASRLAGANAWLPRAVQDFFDCANNSGELKLWVIRVDEAAGIQGFLPSRYRVLEQRGAGIKTEFEAVNLLKATELNAFERALLIPGAAIIALPDLERISIPRGLQRIPSIREPRPLPAFLPCSSASDDLRLVNPYRNIDDSQQRPATRAMLGAIGQTLAVHRPDMQCLLTLPFATDQGNDYPRPCPEFTAQLGQLAQQAVTAPESGDSQRLRHLQFLYPYLLSANNLLSSACGVVAGLQAQVAVRQGSWRSIAGRTLPVQGMPWPQLDQNEAAKLREHPGISVLRNHKGRAMLDDETLCVPLLAGVSLAQLSSDRRADGHWRSAEIMRFMGWLRRELQALGNRMIFDADPRDPRPLMALRNFFQSLHAAGALRGKNADSAFSVEQINPADNVLQFDIEIAPAFPIDRIRITFLQDRHSGSSVPTLELSNG